MSGLSEQEFRVKSDEALQAARQALLPLADAREFEVELQNGVLNLVFEEPTETKFVVSPNAPVRQIWVSAMARSYKLSWAPELGAFSLSGETLPQLLERLTRTFLGDARLKYATRRPLTLTLSTRSATGETRGRADRARRRGTCARR